MTSYWAQNGPKNFFRQKLKNDDKKFWRKKFFGQFLPLIIFRPVKKIFSVVKILAFLTHDTLGPTQEKSFTLDTAAVRYGRPSAT